MVFAGYSAHDRYMVTWTSSELVELAEESEVPVQIARESRILWNSWRADDIDRAPSAPLGLLTVRVLVASFGYFECSRAVFDEFIRIRLTSGDK